MDTLAKVDELKRPGYSAPAAAWDEGEFAALFRQQYSRLAGVAARLLGECGVAEEVAAEALWRLYRSPGLQAEGNNIPGWLYRTTTHLALDALRSRRRWRALRDAAALGADPVDAAPSPGAAFDQRERAQQVRAALRRLKPVQAHMLWLRHSGYSYQEIAVALQMKASSVGTTLARAEVAFTKCFPRGNHEVQS